MATEYQPRYLAYCRAHGRDPEAQISHDRERWPGGAMTGFILWIRERWQAWAKETKHPMHRQGWNAFRGPEDHANFDAWLASSGGV